VNSDAAAALGLDLCLNMIAEEGSAVIATNDLQPPSLPQQSRPPPKQQQQLVLFKAHGFQVLVPPPGAVIIATSKRTPVEVR
jgi:GMP synthase-like glutamine amidotransferase